MTDIDIIRNDILRLHRLPNTAGDYTVYYDESNNICKLRLNANDLNIGAPVCFTLAGVFHRGGPKLINLGKFRVAARISESVEEVKFRTLASGDFLRCMGSQKIETFLDWMHDEGLLIHYQSTDVLYWSIVDIIDSVASPMSGGIIGQRMDADMAVMVVLKNCIVPTYQTVPAAKVGRCHETRAAENLELLACVSCGRDIGPRSFQAA